MERSLAYKDLFIFGSRLGADHSASICYIGLSRITKYKSEGWKQKKVQTKRRVEDGALRRPRPSEAEGPIERRKIFHVRSGGFTAGDSPARCPYQSSPQKRTERLAPFRS